MKKTYPHAKFTHTENKLHFESKIKTFAGYYNRDKVLAPDSGGIMGDISIEAGEYAGKDKNIISVEQNEGVMATLKLAPYCKSTNSHLLAQLYFPHDITYEFKDHLLNIIKSFGSHDHPVSGTIQSKEQLHKAAADESQKDVSNWVETSTFAEQIELAQSDMKRHNYEGARRHFRAASLIDPGKTDFYPHYYEACVKTFYWPEAETVAEKLVKSSPENEKQFIEKYAQTLISNHNTDKAIVTLERALQLSSDSRQKTRLYHALLQLAINKHDSKMIESTCEELLKVSPDEEDVRTRLEEVRKKKKS